MVVNHDRLSAQVLRNQVVLLGIGVGILSTLNQAGNPEQAVIACEKGLAHMKESAAMLDEMGI